jgi:phosphatidylserine/phosphatidylglycerophosphate/cardiolipin synthase-like enzyme
MAEFLTTSGTSYYIENIIIGSKLKLVLVSPYLQISKTLMERLKDADNKGVSITIIYGKDELKTNERTSLSSLKNVNLYYFENLHAKCYFNEAEMVITSMNMYEFSEKNNREMGVFLTKEKDALIYQKAYEEVESIIKSSIKKDLRRNTTNDRSVNSRNPRAFCIRCSREIPFNTTHPLCRDCQREWNIYRNDDYEEKFCHKCGKEETTYRLRPLCDNCFMETNRKSFNW